MQNRKVYMMMTNTRLLLQLMIVSAVSVCQLVSCQQQQQQNKLAGFPGVSKDLASFCAARPSLPIDLASMIVHVKRNVSFNYKLYLFSSDHVFQTGQVIPRDDFRVHSFPVRAKRFHEFWPANLSSSGSGSGQSQQFDLKEFFRLVPLDEPRGRQPPRKAPHDAAGQPLPGEQPRHDDQEPFISHDVAHVMAERQRRSRDRDGAAASTKETTATNLNKFIEFDRDDQVSRLNLLPSSLRPGSQESRQHSARPANAGRRQSAGRTFEQLVLPVGSFSSFHVNLTYLVRKDFDQTEPQLLKILVDANKFQVYQWEVIADGSERAKRNNSAATTDDFAFLSHKLLRDVNTRITSINQIYEDWITRNFYTIVYVQRRLSAAAAAAESDTIAVADDDVEEEKMEEASIVNDRLIFRGSSTALLGADQLDYQVKAAAFITEKNGLHYYLEFLNTGKFYLCAVDWQKRPFKIIDWQQFPIKATRTQFDNEELLLCPPSVCHSNQPIDEIVSYGRLDLAEQIQRQISRRSWSAQPNALSVVEKIAHSQQPGAQTARLVDGRGRSSNGTAEGSVSSSEPSPVISLSQIIEAVKISAAINGQSGEAARLHLRDWVWPLAGIGSRTATTTATTTTATADSGIGGLFQWRYELAKRNDIKAKPDAYGYTLTGHDIDASYRVYNELYLISVSLKPFFFSFSY